ncbi:ABC transporter substrate-binding protein [Natrarchaeobius chitinivorans]|uniref:ABC transporter substrate-binding protein n=1 Tax=Natrarchaeobius chitinivorans TaxID=1679083 RepID=A0A3N6LYB5_NATCH|nr:ABC transporter substrate-binding protein [Natrarchaeobius chitinivorans]RQG95798.1 ABC transporter substrate-binding protein [Natrarchaeobius chitinivorans]
MHLSRRQALTSLAGAGALTLAGCLSGSDADDTLEVALHWNYLDSLDPAVDLDAGIQLFEPLVDVTADANFEPALATSWEPTDDTTWTFDLDSEATFHDGDPVTAEDVVWSLERSFDASANLAAVPFESVEELDDERVAINTTEPFAPMLAYLTRVDAAIISRASIEDGDVVEPIGTGPFEFEAWEPGDSLTVSRFDDYHGREPSVERVVYNVVTDNQTRSFRLENGDAEIAHRLPASSLETLEADDDLEPHVHETYSVRFLVFNTTSPPFDDRRVRQAVSYATDRSAIVDLLEGIPTAATDGPIPPSLDRWAAGDVDGYSHDPERAEALLDESDWDDDREVKLWTYTAHEFDRLAEAIQQQLAAVGFDIDIRVTEYQPLGEAKEAGEFDFSMESWSSNMGGDIDTMIRYFHSSDTDLSSGYDNERIDDLVMEGRQTLDPSERREIYAEIQRTVTEDAPLCYLTYNSHLHGSRASVDGYDPQPPRNMDLTGVEYRPQD